MSEHVRTRPRATYRLQLTPGFGFDAVADVAPYLARLGVSHVYLSPFLQATPGSTHGYDVVDHSRVNDDLGGPAAHARMVQALADHGVGQVIDVVPNHMAITGPENEWWWDVLKQGRASPYAGFFDVDWDPPEAKLRNTVLMPILGDHYGRVLDAGDIRVEPDSDGDGHVVRYADHVLPLAPGSLDGTVDEVNADPDRLHTVLERQHYRLAFWRTATEELDYRRFFDVTSLAALRVEDDEVFSEVHWLALGWVAEGSVDGLRIDHVDGLRDPEGYLRRLADRAPGAWIVVEKILEGHERVPDTWPVAGTTGYDFLNQLDGLFVDPDGEAAIDELYADLMGQQESFADVAHEGKHLVMAQTLAADVRRLNALLVEICEGDRRHRDHTRSELRDALTEVLAAFPVYRTYVDPAAGRMTESDAAAVDAALDEVKARRPDIDGDLLGLLHELLLGRVSGASANAFALRFQQLSGPVMAKGVEDTAFYRFNRFVALNEVGGDPGQFGRSPDDFHDRAASAAWGMLATSTHDTKRSEDVRARLLLLSQIPDRWAAAVRGWSAANDVHRTGDWPDPAMEHLLYQTLVGAWPLSHERAAAYVEKAAREAKHHTSWLAPDADYEDALRQFVKAVLGDEVFLAGLAAFVATLVAPGRITSLAQTLVKLTAPGVPDIYQGTELWDLSLVDPDNRRPVDFDQRRRLLADAETASAAEAWARADDGLAKLFVVQRALRVRRDRPDLLDPDAPYRATPGDDGVLSFERGDGLVTVVPRFAMRPPAGAVELPAGEWEDVFTGVTIDGGAQQVTDVLAGFPVALLLRR